MVIGKSFLLILQNSVCTYLFSDPFWDSSQADIIPSDLSPRALCPDKWHSTAHTCVILFSLCEVVPHLRVKTRLMHLSFFLPPVTPKLLTSTQSFEGSTEATDTFSVSEHSPLYTFVLNQSSTFITDSKYFSKP